MVAWQTSTALLDHGSPQMTARHPALPRLTDAELAFFASEGGVAGRHLRGTVVKKGCARLPCHHAAAALRGEQRSQYM
jgi:hypothetical protein